MTKPSPRRSRYASPAILVVTFLLCQAANVQTTFAQWTLDQMVTRSSQGTTYNSRPIDGRLRNEWPAELEREFQQRAQLIIEAQVRDVKASVNTYFENEKRSYGFLMAHLLGEDEEKRAKALKSLQARDHQHEEWHRETEGIDYYACFTLKHQMRKYFYFGDLLDPAYKRQMFAGAKKWTAKDPYRRPHYAHKRPKEGWGPDARNSWVDIRSTENLFLMRVTSVYLMAEETGNDETTRRYKERILNYAKTLYRIGIGEWDSENYHGHSIAPLLNLYDFAKDDEVQAAAKACLDFFAAAGAVKYWRGGFNGPTKRDYNHAQPFGGSAANSLWVWFGDHPRGKIDHWESDEVHQITSGYRPPLAVVKLARKEFKRPQELFSAKPAYDATTKYLGDSQPEYAETQYLGHSFQMGSLTGGTSVDGGDVNGFKILAFDAEDGAVALHAAPSANPNYPGSPMYKSGIIAAENRIAQLENAALWLSKDGRSPWLWVIPSDIGIETKDGVTFLKCDRTWVGIRPLGAGRIRPDKRLTQQLVDTKKPRFPDHQVLSAVGDSEAYCGLAIEVGDAQSHGDFRRFQQDVLAADVDLSELQQGAVRYKTANGNWLGIHWNDDPLNLGVWRNGKRRDLKNLKLYESSLISADWGVGELRIEVDGAKHRCRVNENGIAEFAKH